MVDIYNEMFTRLKTELATVNVKVSSSYPDTTPTFPCVVFTELDNTTYADTVDSGGENHSDIPFEINVYTNSATKETDAKKIRNRIDTFMVGLGFNRDMARPIPNYNDKTVYRIMMRYSGIVSTNHTIYRR